MIEKMQIFPCISAIKHTIPTLENNYGYMQEYFKKYKLELEDHEVATFEKFLEIFKEKNAQINLSAIRDDEGIIEKHFIDSIMLNVFLDFEEIEEGEGVNVADLGTGGGFPLIPLAIINPDVSFTGIDSVGKKLKAIEDFADTLELTNIDTLNGRAEEIGQNPEYRDSFDYVVSRATAFLPTLLEFSIPLLKQGGIFIAYKLNDKEELVSSKKALARLNAKILKVKNYSIGNQDRTFIMIEKIGKTHAKYPRHVGEPLKNPIK